MRVSHAVGNRLVPGRLPGFFCVLRPTWAHRSPLTGRLPRRPISNSGARNRAMLASEPEGHGIAEHRSRRTRSAAQQRSRRMRPPGPLLRVCPRTEASPGRSHPRGVRRNRKGVAVNGTTVDGGGGADLGHQVRADQNDVQDAGDPTRRKPRTRSADGRDQRPPNVRKQCPPRWKTVCTDGLRGRRCVWSRRR